MTCVEWDGRPVCAVLDYWRWMFVDDDDDHHHHHRMKIYTAPVHVAAIGAVQKSRNVSGC